MFRRHDDRSLCPIEEDLPQWYLASNFSPHAADTRHRRHVYTAGTFTTSPSIANGLRIMTYKHGYGTS